MSDLEDTLRTRLHDRLDRVEAPADLGRGIPDHVGSLRRRRAAALVTAGVVLVAGLGGIVVDSRRGDRNTLIRVADAPDRMDFAGRAEHYAEVLAAGNYAAVRADMNESARRTLTVSRLRAVWQSAFRDERVGEISTGRESRTGDRKVGIVHVSGEAGPGGTLYVVFDSSAKVSEMLLVEAPAFGETWEPAVVRAHEVVNQLAAGDFAAVRRDFDETMLAELSESDLRVDWQQMTTLYGERESTGGHLATSAPTGHRVAEVIVHLDRGVVKVRVAFDARQRIAGLYVLRLDA